MNFIAYAQAEGAANPLANSFLIPMLLIFVIFYFLLIRPQQKKEKERKQMISKLEKNDKIVTIGGIHGVIVSVKDDDSTIIMKTADNTKLEMSRSSVQNKIVPEKKEEEKKTSKKK